jgi:hypothetical protein
MKINLLLLSAAAGTAVEVKLDRPISRPDAVLIVEGGDGGKVELIKQGYPDGPGAVAGGYHGLRL